MLSKRSYFYPDPGIRPPQTRRPESPFLRLENGRLLMITENKMPRIRIRDPFYGHIVDASSPSEIWIRIENHIAPKLEIPKDAALPPVTEISAGGYAMAKVSKDAYGRCRVMEVDYKTKRYLVRFIDHGGKTRLPLDELFEMPKKLWVYPWQTIPVVLFGARPLDGKCWSEDEVATFIQVCREFRLFWVTPAPSLLQFVNDDAYYCRVKLYGIQNPVKRQLSIPANDDGVDVLHLFLASRGTCDDTDFQFGDEQEEYDAVTL